MNVAMMRNTGNGSGMAAVMVIISMWFCLSFGYFLAVERGERPSVGGGVLAAESADGIAVVRQAMDVRVRIRNSFFIVLLFCYSSILIYY